VIRQGDLYWVNLDAPHGSEPGYRRPVIVVQNNLYNASRIRTVLVCSITGNLRRATAPGNVLLAEGEANLPQSSVVNVSQMSTVDKSDLGEYIGTVSPRRMRQILEGLACILEPQEQE
jgi:mRNA interferase MazF